MVGDTNYRSPALAEGIARHGVELLAPKRANQKRERHPWPGWLTAVRHRIETMISQLAERYRAKRGGARDLRHLTSRFSHKVLGHTCPVLPCQREGLSSLRFSELVTH